MVDVDPINNAQQPISDDQELAKVLAGIDEQASQVAADATVTTTPLPPVVDDSSSQPTTDASPAPELTVSMPEPVVTPEPEVTTPPVVEPMTVSSMPMPTSLSSDDLTTVKQDALNELRPLVDKLNVSPEEKFDTYLLLLRSTDDKELIAPAHEAAKDIADEARRAQALLDIIKEIDFLTQGQQQ